MHFQTKKNSHPRCKNAANSVLCTPTNDEFKLPNYECVLRKCTVCSSIALPGVEIDSSNLASMNMLTCI